MGDEAGDSARYRAFISYSHADRAFGRRLHQRLERYRLPGRLVGRPTVRGPVPRRLAPVFLDCEEFSAADDLTAEIRAALAASSALIVVCSPSAMASPWVAREIALFRELHPDRPVLAALAAGEPANAFPPILTDGAEPLAADFRLKGDGGRLALMKLVAGVAGVGLDELVQRDGQARLRTVTAITAGAVAVSLVMSGLAVVAYRAQREAQRQRAEAEALVEFMLTDLRDRLKGVGRLDVLTAVNARTLKYYEGQRVDRLPAASQMRYARILLAMGEDDLTRGDQVRSLVKFRRAERITLKLLRSNPSDPERVLAGAQSAAMLGYHAYRVNERPQAAVYWQRRLAAVQSVARVRPRDPEIQRQLGYAEGDLCALSLRTLAPALPAAEEDLRSAVVHCERGLQAITTAASLSRDPQMFNVDLVNRHGWLANAMHAVGDTQAELKHRLLQENLLSSSLAGDPKNMELRRAWIVCQRELANLEVKTGQPLRAKKRILAAKQMLDELLAFDPANKTWAVQRARVDQALAYFQRQSRPNEEN